MTKTFARTEDPNEPLKFKGNYSSLGVDSPQPDKSPSYWERIKNAMAFKHTVSLDPDDRSLLRQVIDSVRAAPANVSAAFNDAVERTPARFKKALTQAFELPESSDFGSLSGFVKLIADVAHLLTLETTEQIMTFNARLMLEYKWLNVALINALSAFMRYMFRLYTRTTDQGEDEATTAQTTWGDMLAGLVSVLHYYTIGQLPTSIPREVITTLIAGNVVLTTARHIEHFGHYFVKLLKSIANAIWWMFTGRRYFDADQAESANVLADLAIEIEEDLHIDRPGILQVRHMQELHRLGSKAVAIATAREVPKETLDRFDGLLRKLQTHIIAVSGPSQYETGLTPITGFMLKGPSGIGKSFLSPLIHRRLGALAGWTGAPSDWVIPYSGELNFETPLPREPRILSFDDIFIIMDEERYQNAMSLLMRLGTAKPVPKDEPFEKKGSSFYTGTLQYLELRERCCRGRCGHDSNRPGCSAYGWRYSLCRPQPQIRRRPRSRRTSL